MSYFYKKQRPDNNSFNNQIDQSSISNAGNQCLLVNSNIFNKNNNSQTNPKNGYTQINQAKNTSPISYLKNFKKNAKANQENIFIEPTQNSSTTNKNNLSLKKQYEMMMHELMDAKPSQQNKKYNRQTSNSSQRHVKSKSSNEQKSQIRNDRENSIVNHPFLNDQQEQSMQQLLNSSINQFERFLQQQQDQPPMGSFERNQNANLQKTLTKFKSILKQKLEHGLIKQKQQMKNMLNQYVQLITKLLHDKEEMSSHIEEIQEQLGNKANHIFILEKRVEEINKEKDEHIHKTKQQIQEFLIIIEQFENQAKDENERFQEIQKEVQRLRPFEDQLKQFQSKQSMSHKKYSSQQFQDQEKRIECQSEKIQTLLQLLEKSQEQTNSLKQILSKQNAELLSLRKEQQNNTIKSQNARSSQGQLCQFTQQQMQELKSFYEQKLEQLQIQHEEEFIEYEKAIKQTLTKKDECIQRLNFIISELRDGKKSQVKGKIFEESKYKQNNQTTNSKYPQHKKATFDQQMHSMSQNTFNDQDIIEEEQQIRC